MENLFNQGNVKLYPDGWKEVDRRNFNDEEKDYIDKAVVVPSNFGMSVCFICKAGGKVYIPLSVNARFSEYDEIDMDSAQLLTLERGGKTIYRIE